MPARSAALLAALLASACTERALAPPDPNELRDLAGADLALRDLAGVDLAKPDLATVDLASIDLPPPNPCPAGTEFIYTIQDDSRLSRYNTMSNQFFDVATINCPSMLGGSPNSMAIDRTGGG